LPTIPALNIPHINGGLPILQEWEWWAAKTRYPPYKNGNGGQQKHATHPTRMGMGQAQKHATHPTLNIELSL